MRKVRMQNRISIDGFFAGKDPENHMLDWFVQDPLVEKAVQKLGRVDTIVLGRRTFTGFRKSWAPILEDPKAKPAMKRVARQLTEMPKVVFSRSLATTDWDNTTFYAEDPATLIGRLRKGRGGDLLILGSGSIVQQLANAGLIDEYVFIESPSIVGEGRQLFENVGRIDLELLSSRGFKSGNVLLHYAARKA